MIVPRVSLSWLPLQVTAGCVVEALSQRESSWSFTEIMEIRILRKVEKPTDNNADQGDRFISADEAREWQTQQD